MNAKEAYELAKQKGDVSVYLRQIEAAAALGEVELRLDHLLNEFQIKALSQLGYGIEGGFTGLAGLTGSLRPANHKIVWRYAGDANHLVNPMSALLSERMK